MVILLTKKTLSVDLLAIKQYIILYKATLYILRVVSFRRK